MYTVQELGSKTSHVNLLYFCGLVTAVWDFEELDCCDNSRAHYTSLVDAQLEDNVARGNILGPRRRRGASSRIAATLAVHSTSCCRSRSRSCSHTHRCSTNSQMLATGLGDPRMGNTALSRGQNYAVESCKTSCKDVVV